MQCKLEIPMPPNIETVASRPPGTLRGSHDATRAAGCEWCVGKHVGGRRYIRPSESPCTRVSTCMQPVNLECHEVVCADLLGLLQQSLPPTAA